MGEQCHKGQGGLPEGQSATLGTERFGGEIRVKTILTIEVKFVVSKLGSKKSHVSIKDLGFR